jgi:molybdopterin synthase catalytic subunit
VGEDSVHVAASNPHRRAAFEAVPFALEALKRCAEIWKRDAFCDGPACGGAIAMEPRAFGSMRMRRRRRKGAGLEGM